MTNVAINSDGEVIDKSMENVNRSVMIKVNDKFRPINNKLYDMLYGECLYFNNKLYMSLREDVRSIDYIMLAGFNSKEDVLHYLTNTGDLIVKSYLGDLIVTRRDFKMVMGFLTSDCSYSPLLTHMLNHIESYVMTIDHLESDIVIGDSLCISNHIKLADTFAKTYDTFKDFLMFEYDNLDITLLNELAKVYSLILNDVYEHINLTNLNSVSIKYESNFIRVVEFETPSARRYRLNCNIKKEEVNDGGDIDA